MVIKKKTIALNILEMLGLFSFVVILFFFFVVVVQWLSIQNVMMAVRLFAEMTISKIMNKNP